MILILDYWGYDHKWEKEELLLAKKNKQKHSVLDSEEHGH